jgi:hypothetical protein
VHGALRVTIVTGTSAALSDLLCPRMCALGFAVARYRPGPACRRRSTKWAR